jgi:hypothetical protein
MEEHDDDLESEVVEGDAIESDGFVFDDDDDVVTDEVPDNDAELGPAGSRPPDDDSEIE